MKDIIDEFNDRIKQYEELLLFLKSIENQNEINKTSIVNSIKSTLILVIYNAIEYSIKNSIDYIDNEFEKNEYDKFNSDFQSLFLKTFWVSINNLHFNTVKNKINNWLITQNLWCYILEQFKYIDLKDKSRIKLKSDKWDEISISWNINCSVINKISKIYSFGQIKWNKYINTDENKDLLNEIKNKRNNLAHWSSSFSEIWKDLTYWQLLLYKKEVIKFIKSFFKIIKKYLKEKPYIKTVITS